MSWATHDVEPYVIKRHIERLELKLGFGISFLAILIGSWSPDLLTKWFVYGIQVGGYEIKAEDPAQFHRSWPGMGFTHSLFFGVIIALAVWLIFHRKSWAMTWAIGLMIGNWAHVLSDTLDSNGVMLFFPISLSNVHFDAWAYAGSEGRFLDGQAYFSSLGFVWDGFWIAMVLLNYRVLRADYFRTAIVKDPIWGFLGRWMPEHALLALYRGAFFFGVCRWTAWLIWVHVLNDSPLDLSWGGPSWVAPFAALFVPG
ncbi:MAG: metal-dependent hydrolase [Dehalococcoidia bacterium]